MLSLRRFQITKHTNKQKILGVHASATDALKEVKMISFTMITGNAQEPHGSLEIYCLYIVRYRRRIRRVRSTSNISKHFFWLLQTSRAYNIRKHMEKHRREEIATATNPQKIGFRRSAHLQRPLHRTSLRFTRVRHCARVHGCRGWGGTWQLASAGAGASRPRAILLPPAATVLYVGYPCPPDHNFCIPKFLRTNFTTIFSRPCARKIGIFFLLCKKFWYANCFI